MCSVDPTYSNDIKEWYDEIDLASNRHWFVGFEDKLQGQGCVVKW
jgi:hypothetical protein